MLAAGCVEGGLGLSNGRLRRVVILLERRLRGLQLRVRLVIRALGGLYVRGGRARQARQRGIGRVDLCLRRGDLGLQCIHLALRRCQVRGILGTE